MKTRKTNFVSAILSFSLCLGMILFPSCESDDGEDDIVNDAPCGQLECQNGGEAILDVEFDKCRCICPAGYSGENCETKN